MYCSNFQGYGQGHLLVCKDFSYGVVFKQCAERICSDRIKRGIDTELTAVTQNLFDNPEKALHGRGLIQIYPRVSTTSLFCERYYKLVSTSGQNNVLFSLGLNAVNKIFVLSMVNAIET